MSDIDTLIERALVAVVCGRDPKPFKLDAMSIAALAAKASDVELGNFIRHLGRACDAAAAGDLEIAERYAQMAKKFVRARIGESKLDESLSGRPVW